MYQQHFVIDSYLTNNLCVYVSTKFDASMFDESSFVLLEA
jgi:hypothetical protein